MTNAETQKNIYVSGASINALCCYRLLYTLLLVKKQPKIKNYFPVYAKHRFEIIQLDIVDMSNLAAANKNYKYLLVAIDVYSRLAFVVPMKNKTATTVNTALIEILDHTEPNSITTDQGSEFINASFKKILTNRGTDVNYVDVGSTMH